MDQNIYYDFMIKLDKIEDKLDKIVNVLEELNDKILEQEGDC